MPLSSPPWAAEASEIGCELDALVKVLAVRHAPGGVYAAAFGDQGFGADCD